MKLYGPEVHALIEGANQHYNRVGEPCWFGDLEKNGWIRYLPGNLGSRIRWYQTTAAGCLAALDYLDAVKSEPYYSTESQYFVWLESKRGMLEARLRELG